MSKTRLIPVALIALLAGLTYAGKGAQTTSSEAEFWLGKQRDEVVSILGQPEKSKRTAKGEVLVYLRSVEWYATATEAYGQQRDTLDDQGNPAGGAGGPGPGAGPASAVRQKIKLYLDRNGLVYKVKTGKRR
jgi:hypothetical protein